MHDRGDVASDRFAVIFRAAEEKDAAGSGFAKS
jgi:hypothetical protein